MSIKKTIVFFFCFVFISGNSLLSAQSMDSLAIDFGIFHKGDSSHPVLGHTYEGETYEIRVFLNSQYKSEMDSYYFYFIAMDINDMATQIFPIYGANAICSNSMKRFNDKGILGNTGIALPEFKIGPPFGNDQFILLVSKESHLRVSDGVVLRADCRSCVSRDDIKLRLLNSPYSKLLNSFVIAKTFESHPKSELIKVEKENLPILKIMGIDTSVTRGPIVSKTLSYPIFGSAYHSSGIKEILIKGSTYHCDEPLTSFEAIVQLSEGINKIPIEVYTNDGHVLRRSLTVQLDGKMPIVISEVRTWFIGIGIDNYKNWPILNNAVSDVREVYNAFKKNYQFDDNSSVFLLNEMATREGIIDTLRAFISKTGPNDNVVIYYSGHGYYDKLVDEGYWVPAAASLNKTSEYISNVEIMKIVKAFKVKHVVMFVDACFSGSLFIDGGSRSAPKDYKDRVEKYQSRWGICSGRNEEVADGNAGQHSPYAQSIIDYCNGEKADFLISDLASFIVKRVSANANQTPIYSRFKDMGDEGGEFVFHRRKQ